MSRQTTNTSGYPLYPECTCILEVRSVVLKEKRDDPSVKFYSWNFDTLQVDNEEIENELQFLFFSSQMGPLLEALGYEETSPGKYDWDDEEVVGKCIRAQIAHEIFKGQTKHTLKEIEAYEEVGETDGAPVQADGPLAWDAEEEGGETGNAPGQDDNPKAGDERKK